MPIDLINNRTIIILFCWLTVSMAPPDRASSQVTIMPLGDSITYGVYTDGDPTPDMAIGYRQPLWLSLDQSYDVDFVGSRQNGSSAVPAFDIDHEGVPGIKAVQVRDTVQGLLAANPADIVLLHIGTNDLVSGDSISNITGYTNKILENIDWYSPDIVVVMALIIDYIDDRINPIGDVAALNASLADMAQNRIADGDRLYVVDQHSALDYTVDIFDDVNSDLDLHPNQGGYDKMADVWFAQLDDILHLVTPEVAGSGSGTVSPAGVQTVIQDTAAEFTLSPGLHSHIDIDATTGCGGTLAGETFTAEKITNDCTVTAVFALDTNMVTPIAGSHGTISPAVPQAVDWDTTTSFSITPDVRYLIDTVEGCDGTLEGNTYTTGRIQADCEVTATFVKKFPWSMFIPVITRGHPQP